MMTDSQAIDETIEFLKHRIAYGQEMANDATISESNREYWSSEAARAQQHLNELV